MTETILYQVYNRAGKNFGRPTPNYRQAENLASRLDHEEPGWVRGCLPRYDIKVIRRRKPSREAE